MVSVEQCKLHLPLTITKTIRNSDEKKSYAPEKAVCFDQQLLRKRVAIVAAGPAANLLFAVFAYWLILVIGVPRTLA